VPGNHEFDFGAGRFVEAADIVGARTVCANLVYRSSTVRTAEKRYTPWRMFSCADAKVAVIGITATYLDQWLWGRMYAGVETEKAVPVLRRVMPAVLRAKPDMIVLAAHQPWDPDDTRGVTELNQAVKLFPEIDLILGGHSHREIAGQRIAGRTWYVQPGAHASCVAVVQAKIDLGRHQVTDITSYLLHPEPATTRDDAAQKEVQLLLDRVALLGAKAVGRLTHEIKGSGTPGRNCGTSELLCQAIAASSGADVVIHGRLSRENLAEGTVTESDLFRVVPYENTIATAELTVAELTIVISEQLANRSSYVYCGPWGVQVFAESGAAVKRLVDPTGAAFSKDRVKVAFNSYTTAGGGGRFPLLRKLLRQPTSRLHDTGINSRDALREFLGKNDPLTLEVRMWLR